MTRQLRRLGSFLLLCALLAGLLAAPAAASPFRDVPDGHPAAEDIRRCNELGFFQGKGGSFGLGQELTRAAFVTALDRFFGWEEVRPDAPTYDDVAPGDWCYGAVEAAAANGAVTTQSRDFRPNDSITREELAVMLVRALGYETIAGLAQDLPLSYRDIRSNRGYLTVASDMGLLKTSSPYTLAPGEAVLREEAAQMLIRLYDKLHSPASGDIGVLYEGASLPDLAGCSAVAVPAAQLICAGEPFVVSTMGEEEAGALRETVRQTGAKVLLYVVGGPTALNGDSAVSARVLAEAVDSGGYDGIVLDVEKPQRAKHKMLTALVSALREELGDRMFCVVAEAPSWRGETDGSYDYVAMSQVADRLILRCSAAAADSEDGFPVSPPSPLEEVYYSLGELVGSVDVEKLSLLVETRGTLYLNGKDSGTVLSSEIEELLQKTGTVDHWSARYGSHYLTADYRDAGTVKDGLVWYLDGQDIRDRASLLGMFGVKHLCYTSLGDLPAAFR